MSASYGRAHNSGLIATVKEELNCIQPNSSGSDVSNNSFTKVDKFQRYCLMFNNSCIIWSAVVMIFEEAA